MARERIESGCAQTQRRYKTGEGAQDGEIGGDVSAKDAGESCIVKIRYKIYEFASFGNE